jgi:signal transduction histidine kinase
VPALSPSGSALVSAVAHNMVKATRRASTLPSLIAATTVALCAVDVLVVLTSGQPGSRPLVALAAVFVVAFPVAAGLVARNISEYARFAWFLVALGILGAVPVLAYSTVRIEHSVGRVGLWLIEPIAVAALLALPWGRLEGTSARLIEAGVIASIVLLYVPTALLVERYPSPSFWETCRGDCPRNVFMLVDRQPAFVDAWVRPTREFLLIGLYLALVVVLANRVRLQTPLARLMIAPALVVAIVRSLDIAAGFALRRVDPSSLGLKIIPWIFVLCVPGIALAFLVGLVRSRLFAGEALRVLTAEVRETVDPGRLREVLASALRDPSLELAFAGRGRWLDASGREVSHVPDSPDRGVTVVHEHGREVAVLLHDPSLRPHRRFVEAAGATVLSALEEHRSSAERTADGPRALESARRAAMRAQRLRTEVQASLEGLRESRKRLQAAADDERRRIERDLHDSAQERLVALRIHVDDVADVVRSDPDLALERLHELSGEVEEALADVRGLARGVYPALLADEGVAEALGSAARRAPVPTTVYVENVSRYPQPIESAVYFTCLEALQNAYKHGGQEVSVFIDLVDDGALRFEVRDDGSGFTAATAEGTGLMNMRDRISAVGGRLTIDSAPGRGTRVTGSVPTS